MVKRVYKWKPMLTRPLGRPKKRWEDDIINDMKKLEIKNLTSCIQDRNKWELYVEKSKTFKNEVVAPKEEVWNLKEDISVKYVSFSNNKLPLHRNIS